MSGANAQKNAPRRERWLSRWTTLEDIEYSLSDEPAGGIAAWARTTAGIVVMLLALQIATGVLLAFYYVPYTESAQTAVAYVEKVLPAGSWIRSLHHYGSQWLTLFLVLHLTQMFWRASYRRKPVAWVGSVALLAFALAEGATGYSLPWDARAFASTRVAEGIVGSLPLAGPVARRWLLGGAEISTLTLGRFFAVHVLIVPALILVAVSARLFVFRDRSVARGDEEMPRLRKWTREQLTRNAVAAGLVFLALALYAAKFYAPLGPLAEAATPGFLPRPGAQFLWLFQMLKYLPGRVASVVALILPGLILLALAALPFLQALPLRKAMAHPRRTVGVALFALGWLLFAVMTALAYVDDVRDPLVRAQLARQSEDEAVFRAEPFTPLRLRVENDDQAPDGAGTNGAGGTAVDSTRKDSQASASPTAPASPTPAKTSSSQPASPPDAYTKNCSSCHGTRGQGFSVFPRLVGVSAKPHRAVEDIIAIMNDPASYGLRPPMKSYADKLSEGEKREVAEWVVSLKKSK